MPTPPTPNSPLQATTSFSPPTLKMLSYVLFCDTYLHCTCSLIYEAFFTLVVEKRQDVSNAYIFTLTLGWIPHLWGPPSCECEDACVRNTLYHLFVVCFIRDFATFSELWWCDKHQQHLFENLTMSMLELCTTK